MNLKNPKPKYASIDPSNPSALGICDDSDFVFNKEDLVPQMEYRGDNLVPTGFLRGKPFIDEPQPQLKVPPIRADPYPVKNPRLPQPSSSGYLVDGIPAPDNSTIVSLLEQQKFTQSNPDPDVNPLAPKGAPDGIEAPQNDVIFENLTKISFGW